MPESYLDSLRITHVLREATLRLAVEELRLPTGSHGLDAGCGIGLPALLLAEAIGPEGHVKGVDLSSEFVAFATQVAENAGLSDRLSFRQGNVNSLPFDDNTFDWAWSVDCVVYGMMDPLPPLREMVRVVKPGGSVIIMFWSSERMLPGFPLLEARLSATSSGVAPFVKGNGPDSHALRALEQLRKVGLGECTAGTFAGTLCAPLSGEMRRALISLFDMRWVNVEPELSAEDFAEYTRLCQPASPDFIVDHPDYYAFFTYSMFRGTVP